MQQLMITFMAVTGMIAPVATRKLERLMLALYQADRLAAQAVTSVAAVQRGARVARTAPAAVIRSLHVAPAVFWRDRDVDIPRHLTRNSSTEHQKARLAGLSCIQGRE